MEGFYDRHAGYYATSPSLWSGSQLADGTYRSSGYLTAEFIDQVEKSSRRHT